MQKLNHAMLAFLLLGVSLHTANGADSVLQITVDAGETARHNAPIAATLSGLKNAPAAGRAILVPVGGSSSAVVDAQVERTGGDQVILRWIEPDLAAGATKTYTLKPAEGTKPAFRFANGDGYRDLLFGDAPVLRQMIKYDPADHANTFKPFDHVYDFAGNNLLTKGPGGLYTHHRGIFFGFKTDHGDFWHCPDVSQRHVKFLTDRKFAGNIAARAVSVTDWLDKNGTAAFQDTRDVTAWRISPTELILDYRLSLATLTGKIEPIGGDAHHAGFHFRASNDLSDQTGKDKKHGAAHYVRPASAVDTGNDIWKDCPWVECSFDLNGRRYAVTHIDAPTNPKPTTYSTRGYGRFGAFFATQIAPDKPLNLRYRLIIRDVTGATTRPVADVEKDVNDFVKPVAVRVVL